MGSDAIAKAQISAFARDSAKKKKGSRAAKLKQNKLDVRREQWLCQVKNTGCKVEADNHSGAVPSAIQRGIDGQKMPGNMPKRLIEEKHHILAQCDIGTVPWVNNSISKSLGHSNLGKGFTGNRRSCSGSCSSFSSEEDREGDEGCLDDWETMADALTVDVHKQNLETAHHHTNPGSKSSTLGKDTAADSNHRYQGRSRAWAPDDELRPGTLPRLNKQQQQQNTGPLYLWRRVVEEQPPSSCPICCEDFDVTDKSFLPCPCGFRLCLFCHKRILEVDARCPGCRKQYASDPVASQMNRC